MRPTQRSQGGGPIGPGGHERRGSCGEAGALSDKTLAEEEQALRRMADPLNQPSLNSDDAAGNMQTDSMMIAP